MPAGFRDKRDGTPDRRANASEQAVAPWLTLALGSAFTGLVVLQFRAFFSRFGTHLIGDAGDTLLQHLHCAWQWSALSEGRFAEILELPTLHPYSSGLAFGEPLIGVSLPFAPLVLLGVSSAAAYNTALVAAFLLLGASIFLWTRELFDSPAAGLLAAVLVVFVPWRVQLLSNLNNMTVHFAIFGAWLLLRWARDARPAYLLGALMCFHLQLITSAQVAVIAIYLIVFAYAVVWASTGFAVERRRLLQLAGASALFLLLALPWALFFREAFEAARGLPRTREMLMFSSSAGQMLRQFGLLGPLGAVAGLGLAALVFAARRGRLPGDAGAYLLGLGSGATLLFACGLGPYWDAANETVNPVFAISQSLPLLSAYRAPVRMAAFTPIVAALVAGGGFAVLLTRLSHRSAGMQRAALCAPLFFATLWPSLDAQMAAPIRERPADLALARALAELPRDAVILSLPVDLEPSGAAVDERVLIHRRAQIGGFASLIPPVFRNAISEFGQWPATGRETIAALGVTHVVAPEAFVEGRDRELESAGYRVVSRRGGRAIVAAPSVAGPSKRGAAEVRVPGAAAAGRWLTFAVFESIPRFEKRGHEVLEATWLAANGKRTRVEAFVMLPGVVSAKQPIRVHVPTPAEPGRARLEIESELLSVSAEVDIQRVATSFDTAIEHVAVTLAAENRDFSAVRAGNAFPLDVDLLASGGPILLATSLEALPFRRGETLVLARYRPSQRGAEVYATTALSADLVPGTRMRQRWYLSVPNAAGTYDLEISFRAYGSSAAPPPWSRLISGLRVVAH